jgi:hypothetical protein
MEGVHGPPARRVGVAHRDQIGLIARKLYQFDTIVNAGKGRKAWQD